MAEGTVSTKVQVRGAEEVSTYLSLIPEEFFPVVKDAFQNAVMKAHEQTTSNLQNGPLYSRTGHLARSLKFNVSGETVGTLEASLYTSYYVDGTEVPYAPVQEFGATIRAKNKYARVPGGPYLNIPLPPNKTPAGVMRMSAKMVFEAGGTILKSKKGNWIVGLRQLGTFTPMFVLKKEVTIPPRLGMRDAVEDQIPSLLSQLESLIAEDK